MLKTTEGYSNIMKSQLIIPVSNQAGPEILDAHSLSIKNDKSCLFLQQSDLLMIIMNYMKSN